MNHTLLNALLELVQQAEGRRDEMRDLLTAVGRINEAILKELREGDYVTFEERTYVVETRENGTRKVMTVNKGILGPRTLSGQQVYASLEDNVAYANSADRVLEKFAEMLKEQRRWLSDATAKAMTGRP